MSRRPNVLIFFSDDHGYADRGATGFAPDEVSTPALDRIAAEGCTFEQGYVTAPICSPSRAGLLAGAYQARWGARWFTDSSVPPAEYPTIAELFRDQGYRTGYFGKVHYGHDEEGDRSNPDQHGWQTTVYGLAAQSMGRLNYLRHSTAAMQEYGEGGCIVSGVQPLFQRAGADQPVEPLELEEFLTAALGRRARDFIEDAADEPFIAMLAFNAVHNFTWQLPGEELEARGLPRVEDFTDSRPNREWYSDYLDWYDGAIMPGLAHGREYYLAQLELMDREIGETLDTLDRLGLAEDTIVIYATDNGGSTCNFADNAPLSGRKYTLYEGGVRVPYLVRWPRGGVKAGSRSAEVVSTMDILPTTLAAAGADPSLFAHTDGLDQREVWAGVEGAKGHNRLHWDLGWAWAVRSGDLKLSFVEEGGEADAIRQVEHCDPGAGLRLVDLAADIAEHTNLAALWPDRVRELLALHQGWRAEVGLDPIDEDVVLSHAGPR